MPQSVSRCERGSWASTLVSLWLRAALKGHSTPRHFQVCGHMDKAAPEVKGDFWERCLRYRVCEAKACRGRRKGLRGCGGCGLLHTPIVQMWRLRPADGGSLTCSPVAVRIAISV